MIRLIAVAAFALAVATPAQAMPVAPVHEPDGIMTQVAFGCGVGRTSWRCLRRQNHQAPSSQVRCVGCGKFAVGGIETPTDREKRRDVKRDPSSKTPRARSGCHVVKAALKTCACPRTSQPPCPGREHRLLIQSCRKPRVEHASGNQPEADPSLVTLASPVQMPRALW